MATIKTPIATRNADSRNMMRRITTYAGVNLLFALLVTVAGITNGTYQHISLAYLITLFTLCSSPLVLADRLHGRYLILLAFTPLYFAHFGLTDLLMLFSLYGDIGGMTSNRPMLTQTESVILIGGLMLIVGYATSAAALKSSDTRLRERDWKPTTIVTLGVALWVAGMIANWIWQFGRSDLHAKFEATATSGAILVLLAMLHRIGILLLLYAYVTSRHKPLAIIVTGILVLQFLFGFVADSKTMAIEGLIMLVMARFLVDGRVPKTWLIAGCAIFLVSYSLFQAYRDVLHDRSLSREKALENISANLGRAMESSARSGGIQGGARSLSDRLNLKWVTEIIVTKTGTTVAYQEGETLKIFFYAFIPRWILPDKPDTSIGRLVNKEFKISESPLTYIAPSQLGEFYWNFGWPGVILGMAIIGAVMGSISTVFNLSNRQSVLRLLIVLTTIYGLCFRFEGGLGLEYTVWIRSLAIILIMHAIFRARTKLTPSLAQHHSGSQ